MNYLHVAIVLFILILGIICFAGYKGYFKNIEKPIALGDRGCVCAFDLDHTLTCGLEQAANAVKTCKDHNCKIAIVTARPTPWYSDIKLRELGLDEADFIDDFYHGEKFKCSFTSRDCLENAVSSTKVKHLRTLAEKYSVEPERIILFDDQHPNVQAAFDAGFKAIHANHDMCGLPHNAHHKVREYLL